MATKKQSRPKVKGVVNPKGITQVFGTPIDFKALPEKISINRRLSNGKFKLEAHYPAKHFNDKQNYIGKRKEGSYCRFYDNKSPFFIARTVWDAASQPGMHMMVKNRGETHRFIVTPKVDDPTKASVIGSYLVHRDNGDPVLCSGVIGELEAVGDDGDFKVIPYKNHGIRCPKFDSDKNELAGHIPQTFEYKKSTKPRGPRKTAADYCKPTHTFTHPTDIKKAEMVAAMDDELGDEISCLECAWNGTYEDLIFIDADGTGGGGYDFVLACPICDSDEWLDDMMEAEGYDEPCFSCDGMGAEGDEDCSYCKGSGLMSDTLRAEMALYDSEYFDADCGCFKKKSAEDEDKFEAPYAGAGSLMGIKGDSALSSFTTSELTESSAIHGDFDQASLNYSGHQNLEVRAEAEIKIYSFKELSEEAQTKAVADYIEGWEETHEMGDMEYLDALSVLKYDYPMDGLDHYKKDGTFVTPKEAYGAEHQTLSFMDWAKQEQASHMKKYGAETNNIPYHLANTMDESQQEDTDELKARASHPYIADYIQSMAEWGFNHQDHMMLWDSMVLVIESDERGEFDDHKAMWDEESKNAEGKKNCGCGKDPCITYGADEMNIYYEKQARFLRPLVGKAMQENCFSNQEVLEIMDEGRSLGLGFGAEGSGEITKKVVKDYHWETEPHPHEHDDLIYNGYVNEEMKGVMEDALEDGDNDSWVSHTHYTTDEDGKDVEVEVSGIFLAEDKVPRWAKPLGLIGGLAIGYISAQMIDNKRSDIND